MSLRAEHGRFANHLTFLLLQETTASCLSHYAYQANQLAYYPHRLFLVRINATSFHVVCGKLSDFGPATCSQFAKCVKRWDRLSILIATALLSTVYRYSPTEILWVRLVLAGLRPAKIRLNPIKNPILEIFKKVATFDRGWTFANLQSI